MDEKPKRKRGQNPTETSFVTALSVEECIERLERGPSHTLDYRLSVRTDDDRFKIEVLGEADTGRGSMTVLAEMNGYLQLERTRHLRKGGTLVTRVVADTKISVRLWDPRLAVWIMIIWQIGVIVYMVSEKDYDPEILVYFGFLLGGLFSAIYWISSVSTISKVNRQLPDLHEWLMDQIYEPPDLVEEE